MRGAQLEAAAASREYTLESSLFAECVGEVRFAYHMYTYYSSCALRADTWGYSCSYYSSYCSSWHVYGGLYEGECDTTCGLYSTCTDSSYATCTAVDYDMCDDAGNVLATMGTLELQETTDGVSWSTIWTKSDDQGDSWQFAEVAVATMYVNRLRFIGTTSSSSNYEYGDMAMLHYSRSQRIEQLEGLSR